MIFELVPLLHKGEVVLHDIYETSSGARVWYGSRRTVEQCHAHLKQFQGGK